MQFFESEEPKPWLSVQRITINLPLASRHQVNDVDVYLCNYGKSDEDYLNELCGLSDQLSRGSWRNPGFVWYLDNKSDNKISAIDGTSSVGGKMAY